MGSPSPRRRSTSRPAARVIFAMMSPNTGDIHSDSPSPFAACAVSVTVPRLREVYPVPALAVLDPWLEGPDLRQTLGGEAPANRSTSNTVSRATSQFIPCLATRHTNGVRWPLSLTVRSTSAVSGSRNRSETGDSLGCTETVRIASRRLGPRSSASSICPPVAGTPKKGSPWNVVVSVSLIALMSKSPGPSSKGPPSGNSATVADHVADHSGVGSNTSSSVSQHGRRSCGDLTERESVLLPKTCSNECSNGPEFP